MPLRRDELDPGDPRSGRVPRAVPAARVADWYREGLRLFRRAPATFMLLALAALLTEIGLSLIPVAGGPLATMVAPLVACGMLYASLAADRGEPVRLRFAVLAFGAPLGAMAAVLAAAVATFAAQATVAWWIQGVNLLAPADADALSPGGVLAVFAAGVAASLPLAFVPFAALFDGEAPLAAMRTSLAAAACNARPLALYGAAALALAFLGLATYGVALLVALPLWAASSYAAWKDVFSIDGGAGPDRRDIA